MATSIFRFTNSGEALGMLKYDEAVHEEDLDGTDKLTVTSQVTPAKRDRLVWRDNSGAWHEHMVDTTVKKHGENRPRTESTCSNSISELYGVIASGTKLKGTVQQIMTALLSGTRWTVGNCSDFGTVQIEVWHKNVRECIAELCEMTGGELETFIAVGNFNVIGRSARIVRARGSNRAVRQFMYGRNVTGINREVAADEVFTAIIGYGAKVAETALQAQLDALNNTDTSNYTEEQLDAHNDSIADLQEKLRKVRENDYAERLTVTVQSGADLSKFGIPSGSGYAHNYTTYTDNGCTDATFLTKQCRGILRTLCKPLVRYEFDVSQTDDSLWSDVRLGNRVLCLDETFYPTLELDERVSYIRRRLAGRMQCRIAIGKRSNYLTKQYKAAEKTSKKTTGNNSNTSPYAPTNTNGNYSGEGGNPSYDPTPGSMPTSLKITTPPTKTTYNEGERIDYTGIVCTLYDENGAVYTDSWYPDGIVPFEELIFTQEIAIGSKEYSQGIVLSELLDGLYKQPAPISFGHAQMIARFTSATIYEKSEWSGNFTAIGTSDHSLRIIFASETPSTDVNRNVYRKQYTPGTDTDTPEGEYKLIASQTTTLDSTYTKDGKTVYYGQVSSYFVGYGETEPSATYIGSSDPLSHAGPTAWAIIYGDVRQIADPTSIPVSWTRSDGETLSDSFNITVNENQPSGPGWGQTIVDDEGSSSGGGDDF